MDGLPVSLLPSPLSCSLQTHYKRVQSLLPRGTPNPEVQVGPPGSRLEVDQV